MRERVSTYTGQSVEITYDRDLCIHAAECGRGSKALFDASKDPWCDPDAVSAEQALAVVARCPTGALKARRLDGAADAKAVSDGNVVTVNPDGPLYVQGDVTVNQAPAEGGRLALCRCGASSKKPFCDGSHVKAGFKDSGPVASDPEGDVGEAGVLAIATIPDGPLIVDGPVTLRAASGRDAYCGRRLALCRCGASQNKPFCDGSHTAAGFKAD